ncbi:MAG: CAAX protease, partial [Streptococcus salivarius]|nr:CAAX protease [Streptococcus salivarius]
QLPYVTVLSVLLYGLVLGFALIRLILSKIG